MTYIRLCLKNLTNTDVIIHCNDGTVAAHKLVLASISQMIFVEFSISQEETASIFLPDCSTEEISNYLDAVYSCKSLSRFHSLNQMFGYEMAVKFLPNLLHYNKEKTKIGNESVSEEMEGIKKESSEEEDDQEVKVTNSQGEEKKPVVISFLKKPASDGVKKVISFMKKNQSPDRKKKSSKVWVHFDEDLDDPTKRSCKYCGHVVISPDKSTWTMHAHIVNKHKDKVFSFSDGIILQNFEDEAIKRIHPSPSIPKKDKDESSIDPETGEVISKSKKKKRPNPSPSRHKEEKNDSSLDPETGELISKSKKGKRAKTSQVWNYFDIDEHTGKSALLDPRNRDMEKQLASDHNINTKKQESLMCSICGQHFNNERSRTQHENSQHLAQYRVYCSYCGRGFMSLQSKITHERTHVDEMPESVAGGLQTRVT